MTDSDIKQYLDELIKTLTTTHNISIEEAKNLIKRSDMEKLIREDINFASCPSVSFWADMLYILHKKQ